MQPKRLSGVEPHAAGAAGAAVDSPAVEVKEPPTPMKVYFDGDSVDVAEQFHESIRLQAERFVAGPGGTLVVSGHANPADAEDDAVRLSMDRTGAVAQLLERFGVQSHRIIRVSHATATGDEAGRQPAASCATLAGEQRRYVEIRLGGLMPRQTVWSQRTKKAAKR
ncbi:MAG: OmpA family protein [Burkholderiaceae bacterium]